MLLIYCVFFRLRLQNTGQHVQETTMVMLSGQKYFYLLSNWPESQLRLDNLKIHRYNFLNFRMPALICLERLTTKFSTSLFCAIRAHIILFIMCFYYTLVVVLLPYSINEIEIAIYNVLGVLFLFFCIFRLLSEHSVQ